MNKLLSYRENLQDQIELEWVRYRKAISDNKPFEEIKIIYLRIKELQKEIVEVTDRIQNKLEMGD